MEEIHREKGLPSTGSLPDGHSGQDWAALFLIHFHPLMISLWLSCMGQASLILFQHSGSWTRNCIHSYLMFMNDIYKCISSSFVVCVLYVQGVGNKEWREVRWKFSLEKTTVLEGVHGHLIRVILSYLWSFSMEILNFFVILWKFSGCFVLLTGI